MTFNPSLANIFQSKIARLFLVLIGAIFTGVAVTILPEKNAVGILASFLVFFLILLVFRPLTSHVETRSLFTIVIISLILHLAATLLLHPFAANLESDAISYANHGWLIAENWRKGIWITYENAAPYVIAPGYTYLNAFIYYFSGFNPLIVKLLNTTLGALTAVPLYFLSRSFFSHRVSIIAAALVAFAPSMLFWSTQNLKDTLVVFFSVTSLYLVVKIGRSRSTKSIFLQTILLVASLVYLYFLRAPAAAFLLFWVVFQVIIQAIKGQSFGRFVTAILLSAVLLTIVWQVAPLRNLTENAIERGVDLQNLDRIRAYRTAGGSSFGENFNVSSIQNLIRYSPSFLTAYLLRPFPWEVDESLFQRVTIPEMFVWYGIFIASLFGILLLIKRDWLTYLLIWVYPISVALISAPQYGNLGTTYRHRAQIFPFFFILAAVAIVYIVQKRDPFQTID